ncbi:MAG: 5'-methylthioadenosine/adenosylhomocysteine nucleosidase [Bacteroidaceae bacterium]|nr:5'-methylthioadenosine/adenosylhomocysteine nucleosidase [Bacteroidaceae bacterium]
MKIGILSAMTKEHEQLTVLLADAHTEQDGRYNFVCGRLGNNTLILLQCGIGKVNAAVGTATLIRRYAPDCIISTGCAGGIDAGLHVMDVVVSTQVAYHDVSIPGCEPGQVQGLPARFRAEQELVEAALNSPFPVKPGLICSGDQFISDRAQLDAIKAQFPEALAVDMESAAIAQTCFLLQTPFVSFRVLSDTPGADEHIQQYFNFWDEMADRSFEVTRRFLAALPERFSLLPFDEK